MKKLKYRAVIALRFIVLIVPALVWLGADVLSGKSKDSCQWLADALPDPRKWR